MPAHKTRFTKLAGKDENSFLEEKFKFERIIFQKQENNNLGIVLHTKNRKFINEYFKSKNEKKFKEDLQN